MEHAIYRVLDFEQLGTYTLRVAFEQVRIDPDFHTLVWPNDADFDPAGLHDWPEVREQFIRSRAEWRD